MRTTVTIDDDLYRLAKSHAALTGQSVGSVIEDGLRHLLARSAQRTSTRRPLPVFSSPIEPGVDLADGSTLADLLDEGSAIREIR